MTTEQSTSPTRRAVLTGLAATAAGALVSNLTPGRAMAAQPPAHGGRTVWSSATSQNGWPVLTHPSQAPSRVIEGSDASVAICAGAAATILLYVARRFHYEIQTLRPGDVHGWTTDHHIAAGYESNYLSGTAIAICPGRYPAGSTGNLFGSQITTVRDILHACEGAVSWGGDDHQGPKEGHFQIVLPAHNGTVRRVAEKIGHWDRTPGLGAGTPQ